MDDSKKKSLMFVMVVGCLAVACGITFMRMRGTGDSLNTIDSKEKVWVKCSDEQCNAAYEINLRDYLKYVRDHTSALQTPPLVCQKCGKETVYRAVKCAKCGEVFFAGTVQNDFEDRCPKCGYSKIEEGRKHANTVTAPVK